MTHLILFCTVPCFWHYAFVFATCYLLFCVTLTCLNELVGAPDADILLEAIEELRKNKTAGAATFLVKVKAHRGEPANEEANIKADKAISGKDVPTEWHDRTN